MRRQRRVASSSDEDDKDGRDGGMSSRSPSPPRGRPRTRQAAGSASEKKGAEKKVELLANAPLSTKMRSLKVRTASTFLMVGGFVLILYLGHVVTCALVFAIQCVMMHELFTLAAHKNAEKKLPGFRMQQWYFFFVAAFFGYFSLLKHNLLEEVNSPENSWIPGIVGWCIRKHVLIANVLYNIGLVMFVTSLRKPYIYQFGQFAWTHMILLIVFLQSSFFVANIFEGLIWFVLPASLVIINDIFAYLFGFFFGRTPLIKISPKKTWEGFLGALFTTVCVSYHLSRFLASSKWFVCPRNDLTIRTWLNCEPVNTFQPLPAAESLSFLPQPIRGGLLAVLPDDYRIMPIQLHALSFAVFAALIAPFGGFFASGLKRALKLKDFGDSIPGHGGLTDRMDCQCIMAMFSYIYLSSVVGFGHVSVDDLLEKAIRMTLPQQEELFKQLGASIAQQRRLGL